MDLLTFTPADPTAAQRSDARVRYEDDPHGWASAQAHLLRTKQWRELDVAHLADEIEDLARRERNGLRSDLAAVLQHLLKWERQQDRRTRSWALSVREHRRTVSRALNDSPSLGSKLQGLIAEAYEDGRDAVLRETDLLEVMLPAFCPDDWDAIMTRPIDWPESP